MRILVEMGHPAHVHYLKNFIKIMKQKGHNLLILNRDKEMTSKLLDEYNINHVVCGKNKSNLLLKSINMAYLDYKIYQQSKVFNPDIFLSPAIPYNAHVGKFLKKPVIGFGDTEHATLITKFFLPFANVILTPHCFLKDLGSKQIRFKGNLELMYLHQNYFKPDASIYKEIGIGQDKEFAIVRFVSWNASHDVGQKGLSISNKISIVKEIEKHAVPFISFEGEIPQELKKYQIKIRPNRIHDALYYASLYIGEGATMASEAAVLGTPSIYVNTLKMGYINEEKDIGLIRQYEGGEGKENDIIMDIRRIMRSSGSEWENKRKALVSNKIDVTAFFVWFLEGYPYTYKLLKTNPIYQEKFIDRFVS